MGAHSRDSRSKAVVDQVHQGEEGSRDNHQVVGNQARERSLGIVQEERPGEEDVGRVEHREAGDVDPRRLQLKEVDQEALLGVADVDREEVLLPVEGTVQEEEGLPPGVGIVLEVHQEVGIDLEEEPRGVVGTVREGVGSIPQVEGNIHGEVDSSQRAERREEHREEERKVLDQAERQTYVSLCPDLVQRRLSKWTISISTQTSKKSNSLH
ncbi:hypothetical protein BKA70DRAFT_1269371 [Coprinopsis sp. MPI-PUGE-AT-0042]|nr:hypothetical protein BKA70DRAFT_1269371 [Coprinopsis sp. MPI-PUGE-AT-0042]